MNGAQKRVVVLGNSGAGKSTLARALAAAHGLAHLDLDTLAWHPTDPPERTPLDEAGKALDAFTNANTRWVVEGCYADLAALIAPRADTMIFLDLSVAACQQHARARPWEPHKYPSQEAQDANLPMLLDWIAAYPEREGPLGRPAHAALFERFQGHRDHRT